MNESNEILNKYSIRLPDNISTYKAELCGILTALQKVISVGYTDSLTIFTDSLSSVQSIATRHTSTNPNMLNEIYRYSKSLRPNTWLLCCCYVLYVRCRPPPFVIIISATVHPGAVLVVSFHSVESLK